MTRRREGIVVGARGFRVKTHAVADHLAQPGDESVALCGRAVIVATGWFNQLVVDESCCARCLGVDRIECPS